ncbi:DNA gyrase inhibitor YacG [Actinobacillus genomosp. 1]|uniref:DNA gyrase inhibitor YacG n=1 Tax=Actinobacillus genomosp. 1 TaxID=254839 RepID=UPI0024434986|nr:DNA gyrase inhibitor YacG [Actinobacillus genomosp. 1]WGE36869.1 DNA gyrase inhibitor YacG [Actinobacillus genomosp. 1]WGE92264.1 DNA gyrase inhibitor YacG [Actinobacillus genomosp. 1]
MSETIVNCPTCHQEVVWKPENKYRPFCSERCQLIDLGEWANEEKRIAAVENDVMTSDLEGHY